MSLVRVLSRCVALAALCLLQACATGPQRDPRDPIEPVNRAMFAVNDGLDVVIVKPLATVYRNVLPNPVRRGVSNFFGNLGDVWSAVNNGLQGKGQAMGDSAGRVLINSTVGLLGIMDVATDLNIERHPADFGMTLGKWGLPPGPYIVLPILGPYTLREVAALPIDRQGNLINQMGSEEGRNALTFVNGISIRANYLGADAVIEGASLDKYTFSRDAYLQRQRNRQYDGNPPDETPQD